MSISKQKTAGVVAGVAMTAAALMTASTVRAATTLFDSNGFEPSTTVGAGVNGTNHAGDPNFNYRTQTSLSGQPFTTPVDTVPTTNKFQAATAGTGVQASVQDYATVFGSTSTTNRQFAYLSASQITTGTVGEFYPLANTATPYAPITSGNPVVDVVFQMSVAAASAGEPLFGVTAFDGTNRQIGQLMVDGGTGQVIGGNALTNPNVSSFGSLGLGNFYSFELQLNYATQTANLYEAPIGATTFTNLLSTNTFTNLGVTPATTFGYAALTSYTPVATNGGASGSAFIDNYSVVANGLVTVPEPGMASLALGGLAVLGGRRRRRSSAC